MYFVTIRRRVSTDVPKDSLLKLCSVTGVLSLLYGRKTNPDTYSGPGKKKNSRNAGYTFFKTGHEVKKS